MLHIILVHFYVHVYGKYKYYSLYDFRNKDLKIHFLTVDLYAKKACSGKSMLFLLWRISVK